MFCAKCGKQMSEREEILGDGCLHIIGSCFECNIQKDIGIVVEGGMIPTEYVQHNNVQYNEAQNISYEPRRNRVKKKDSALSTIACAFSFFSIFMPIILAILFVVSAFVIAVVDLGIYEEDKKHIGSWLSFVFCAFNCLMIYVRIC